jgi:hypothetical protein
MIYQNERTRRASPPSGSGFQRLSPRSIARLLTESSEYANNIIADKKQVSAHEQMCCAIDAAPPEYFTAFGIIKESWQRWRESGQGAPSTGAQKWIFPRLTELIYPRVIKSVQDWDNWVKGLNLDRRLGDRCCRVLIVLAQYLNLKTGRCDPTMHHLAMMAGLGDHQAAERMARMALREGEEFGWIKRHFRRGGHRSRSNRYEFLIPLAVTQPPELEFVDRDGKWFTAQVADGKEVCGPFKTREAAARWTEDRGPQPDKSDPPTGQIGDPNRTQESARTENDRNREYKKHSVSSIRPSSLCSDGHPRNLPEKRKGEFNEEPSSPSRIPAQEPWRGYTDEEVQFVEDAITNFDIGTISGIVACARKNGFFLTGNALAKMCADGHFGRDGDNILLPTPPPA